MDYPEYLGLFSNQGKFKVKVVFQGFDGSVADTTMMTEEIGKLIDPSTGEFYRKMYFDDHLHEVYKLEVDLLKYLITIKARP